MKHFILKSTRIVFSFFCTVFLSLLLLTTSSCDELPSDVGIPSFVSGATIPLLDTSVTLSSLLEQGSFVKADKSGNYSIEQTVSLPTLRIADSLQLQPIQFDYSSSINEYTEFTQNFVGWDTAEVRLRELFLALPNAAVTTILPPTTQEIQSSILPPSSIEYVHCSKGKLFITITNNFPFDIEFGKLKDKSTVGFVIGTEGYFERFIPLRSNQIMIPKGEKRGDINSDGVISLDLGDVVLNKQSYVRFVCSTKGSNNHQVAIHGKESIVITTRLQDVIIESAKMKVDRMQLSSTYSTELPNNQQISSGRTKSIEGSITIQNTFPIDGTATIEFPQFWDTKGNRKYSTSVFVEANSKHTVYLKDLPQSLLIEPDSEDRKQGNVIRSIRSVVTIKTLGSDQFVHFTKSNRISILGNVGPITFNEVNGLQNSLHTLDFVRTVELTNQEIEGLQFNSLLTKEIQVLANINNGISTRATLNGTAQLLGKNGNVICTLPLQQKTIEPSTNGVPKTTELLFTFFNVSLGELPSKLKIIASVKPVGTTYFSLNENSYVSGDVTLKIPLAVQISGGEYSSTSFVQFPEEIKELSKDLQHIELLLESRNSLPVEVVGSFRFFDSEDKETFSLDSIVLKSRMEQVEGKSLYRIMVVGTDISKLLSSTKVVLSTFFNAQNNGMYAQFKNTDCIKVKMNCTFSTTKKH